MSSYLLDTHIWVWDLRLDANLPKRMLDAMDEAENVFVSVISFYEIAQKVRLQKWTEMAPYANDLQAMLAEQGYQSANLTADIGQFAGLLEWDHRDPFDRMIAATSILLKLPLISTDTAFDALSSRKDWPGRVW